MHHLSKSSCSDPNATIKVKQKVKKLNLNNREIEECINQTATEEVNVNEKQVEFEMTLIAGGKTILIRSNSYTSNLC